MTKRYLILCDITNAAGTQTFYVDAESEAEAIDIFKSEGGEMYASECEVQDLGKPELIGTTSLDDYGDFWPAATSQQAEGEPIAWRREWDGDESDLGSYVYASSEDELDNVGEWEPLYAAPPSQAPEPAQQEAAGAICDSEILRIALLRTDAGLNRGTWTFTDKDVIAFARALSRAAPVMAEGWKLVPGIGCKVKANHPITVLNPEEYFEVAEVRAEKDGGFCVRGEKTCWFGLNGIAATEDYSVYRG